MTMQVIQHIELGASATSISFTSIPQTYTDLYLLVSTRNSSTFEHLLIGLNGSTSSFSERYLTGYGGGGATGSSTYARYLGNTSRTGYTANTFGSASIYIANYTSSANKSISAEALSENNNASDWGAIISANLWSVTNPITSIQLTNEGAADILQYSSATLYGILKGNNGVVVS